MRGVVIVLLACALGAAGVMGAKRLLEHSQATAAAKKERARQESEVKQCKQRLAQFHKSWSRYRAAHNGAEPPKIDALIPKYIPDPKVFECPTAARFAKEGGRVDQGQLKVGRRDYPFTYGFLWLTAGYAVERKKHAEKAALVACTIHREVVYQAAYKRPVMGGEFDQPARGRLVREVVDTPVLVVQRNGQVSVAAD